MHAVGVLSRNLLKKIELRWSSVIMAGTVATLILLLRSKPNFNCNYEYRKCTIAILLEQVHS